MAREGASVACVDVNEEAAMLTADMCAQRVPLRCPSSPMSATPKHANNSLGKRTRMVAWMAW